jgi:hypothetical protein
MSRARSAAVALVLLVTAVCPALSPARVPSGRPEKGKARLPDTLTPGEVETVLLQRLPANTKFQLSATIDSNDCPSGNCQFTPAHRAPDTRPFRTSRTGRAKGRFVMPAGFMDYPDGPPFENPHFVPFVNGDRVQIHVDAPSSGALGFANAFSTIKIP